MKAYFEPILRTEFENYLILTFENNGGIHAVVPTKISGRFEQFGQVRLVQCQILKTFLTQCYTISLPDVHLSPSA